MKSWLVGSSLAFLGLICPAAACSQVGVAASSGTLTGTYSTLKNAFDAINAGTHQGTITITISANVTETASAVINASGSGAATYTSVTISPTGGAVRTISGSLAAPLIDLNGADNVAFNGLNTGGNGLILTNASTAATAGTSTIRFINDATLNTISRCTVLGASTGAPSQNGGAASAVTATILFAGSTGITGNDNNTISNSTISDAGTQPTVAIGSAGESAALSNDNVSLTGNNIANFYGANGANGINVASNSAAWTITGNKLYQTAARSGLASANYLECIYVNSTGGGFIVNNNTIGYASSGGTGMLIANGGRFIGIDLAAVAATPASNIQGNTVNGINWTTASGASAAGEGTLTGILVKEGGVNMGTTGGNRIGSFTAIASATANIYLTSSASGTGICGIYASSAAAVTISNNVVGGICATGAADIGFTFTGIQTDGTGSFTIMGNSIGGSVADNIMIGVLDASTGPVTVCGIANSGAGNIKIGQSGTGNNINNITIHSSGANIFYGIYNTGAVTGTNAITYNNVNNIRFTAPGTATTYGGVFSTGASPVSTFNITNNVLGTNAAVFSGTTGGTGPFYGIYQSGTPLNGLIASNGISGLSVKTSGPVTLIFNNYTAPENGSKTVQNNTVNGFTRSAAVTSHALYGYYDSASSPGSVSHIISGNLFNNVNASSSGSIVAGIYSTDYSGSNPGLSVFNNSVTNLTVSGSGAVHGLYLGGFGGTAAVPNEVYNNTVSGITSASTSTSQTGISILAAGLYVNVRDNIVQNNTFTGAGSRFAGISGLGTMNLNKFYNNKVVSNTSSATTTLFGILISGGTQTDVYANTVNTLSSAGNVYGLYVSAGTTVNVYGHQVTGGVNKSIYSLSSTGAATIVEGVRIAGGTTVNVHKNSVYGLSSSSASATAAASLVNGVSITDGSSVTIYNNLISQLTAPAAEIADAIRGISVTSATPGSVYRVYHNTVYLSASSTGTNFGTSGVYHTGNATATTASLDLRNNIVINQSAASGTGLTVAFRRAGNGLLANFASTSNRNLLFAGSPSAANLIMYDGTNSYQTLVSYQALVAPREVNSFTGESFAYGTSGSFFTSLTGSNASFLKPVAGITTQAESGAANSTTPAITTDFAGVTRPGNTGYTGTGVAPDLGALEFEGVTPAPVITLSSVTPPAAAQCAASPREMVVNVTTLSGTITAVNLVYSLDGIAQAPVAMTFVSGTTWTGAIPVAAPLNATVSWAVTATNSAGLGGSYTGASYADEPLLDAIASATASLTTVCAGSPVVLTAGLSRQGAATIGSAATVSTNEAAQTPFYGGYGGVKTQYLVSASELTAAGLAAGNITSLALTISGTPGAALTGFAINAETTSLTALTTNIEPVGNQVYSNASFIPVTGLNTFTFSAPLAWDGTSNIILSFCWSNNNTSNTASNVVCSATSFVSANARYVNSRTPAEVCGYTGNTLPADWNGSSVTLSLRPDFVFRGTIAIPITSISWSDGSATIGTTNPLSVSPAVTTTYTPAIMAAGCVAAPSPTTTVTVNSTPPAPASTNASQCGTQVPTASVASASGATTPTFRWYDAANEGVVLQNSTSATYMSNVAATTTFYVSELNTTTGCESPRTAVTVTVATADAVAAAAALTSVCIGESVTLTASNTNPEPLQSYTYSWSGPGGSGAVTPVTGASVTVTPTIAGTYTYNLAAVDGGCSATATATVTVSPFTTVVAPIAATCNGASDGSFSQGAATCGTAPFTYSVDGSAFGAIPANLAAGTYAVTVKDANGFTAASQNITITQPATTISVPAGVNASVCQDASSAIVSATASTSVPTPQTLTLTFGLSAQPAEVSAGSAGTVADNPNSISTATMPGLPAGAVVTGAAFSFPGITPTGGSSGSNVNFGFDGAVSAAYAAGTGTPGPVTSFDYTNTLAAGAVSVSGGTVELHYLDLYDDNNGPEAIFPVGASVATLTINYTIPSPATISWWNAATNGTQLGTGSSFETVGTTVLSAATTPGTYIFYAQGQDGACPSPSRTAVTVTVKPKSTSSVTASACGTYTLNGTAYGTSGIYTQTLTNSAGCDSTLTLDLTIHQPTSIMQEQTVCGSYTLNGTTYDTTGVYTQTLTNAAGCDSTITLDLTILELPAVNAGTDQAVCVGTATVTLTATGAGTLTWNNGVFQAVPFTPTATTTYTVTADNGTCTATDEVTVTVNTLPAAAAELIDNVTLTASVSTAYQWNDCGTGLPIPGATSQTFTATANGSYSVTATGASGCSATSACVNVTKAGIKETTDATVSVFPNPANGSVTVTMASDNAAVEIADATGKTLRLMAIDNGGKVDLSAYEAGVYFLKIKTHAGSAIERVVKN